MSQPQIQSFEELARDWAPRAKRFLTLLANNLMTRLKLRLPGLIGGSAFLLAAVFCVVGVAGWLSILAWFALQDRGYSQTESAGYVAGALAVLTVVCYGAARWRARRPKGAPPIQLLGPENHEIEAAGQDLITLFKDLTIAAKRSLSPNEVLKPHAVKVAVATTALGFLIALNLNPRKEKINERD